MKKLLIVSDTTSKSNNAYNQRLVNFKEGLNQNGVVADMLFLGDYPFKSPLLIDALDIPFIRKKIVDYATVDGGGFAASYVIGLMKKIKKITLIQDVHGCIEESQLKMRNLFDIRGYFMYFEQFVLKEISNKCSDYFITCSKPLRDRLLYQGINEKKTAIMRNGVDTNLFKPYKSHNSNSNNFVVTYAGAFQKWQGIDNFVSAAAAIKATNVSFKIIGFREQDRILKKKLKSSLGCKVELLNSMSQKELVSELNISDLLVIPRIQHCATQMAFDKISHYISAGKLL